MNVNAYINDVRTIANAFAVAGFDNDVRTIANAFAVAGEAINRQLKIELAAVRSVVANKGADEAQ